MIQVRAYAKINLTLEVLGRRPDGYHEVRSVMQTLRLHDTLWLRQATSWRVSFKDSPQAIEDDLIARAGRVLEQAARRPLPTEVCCEKRIPIAAGLGGGSSNAAAALVGLRRLWRLPLSDPALDRFGASLGSDVPFLLRGGTALAGGRGDHLTPLPPVRACWVILALPNGVSAPTAKTAAMYARLRPEHYSQGEHTQRLLQRLERHPTEIPDSGWNVFELIADEVFPGINALRQELSQRSGLPFRLSGAGPALYALVSGRQEARACQQRLAGVPAALLITRTASARPRPLSPGDPAAAPASRA